jgi:1,3-beta-glucanosyltransferase GAS1
MTTKAPACPAFTAGGWSVSPNAPLPTLGALAISSGMPSGVPQGSITVTGVSSVVTSAPENASSGGSSAGASHSGSGASTTSSEDGSATSAAGAVRQPRAHISFIVAGIDLTNLVVGLAVAGAGFILFL